MSPDLDKKLCEKYPALFKDRYSSPQQTAMCWGFPGDGWFALIDVLCGVIQARADEIGSVFVAQQVKEKWGKLEFDISPWDDYAAGAMQISRFLSTKICEMCGARGELLRDRGWHRTLCATHSAHYQLGNLTEMNSAEVVFKEKIRSVSVLSDSELIDVLKTTIDFDVKYNDGKSVDVTSKTNEAGHLCFVWEGDDLGVAGMIAMLEAWSRHQVQQKGENNE